MFEGSTQILEQWNASLWNSRLVIFHWKMNWRKGEGISSTIVCLRDLSLETNPWETERKISLGTKTNHSGIIHRLDSNSRSKEIGQMGSARVERYTEMTWDAQTNRIANILRWNIDVTSISKTYSVSRCSERENEIKIYFSLWARIWKWEMKIQNNIIVDVFGDRENNVKIRL